MTDGYVTIDGTTLTWYIERYLKRQRPLAEEEARLIEDHKAWRELRFWQRRRTPEPNADYYPTINQYAAPHHSAISVMEWRLKGINGAFEYHIPLELAVQLKVRDRT